VAVGSGQECSKRLFAADALRLVFQTQPRSGKNQIPKGFQGTMTEFHVSHLPAK
jgi:ketosteroid isomerase-like protein